MTDDLHGRPASNPSFDPEEEEEEMVDIDDDPAPADENVETFTISDEELENEVEADPFAHRKPKSAHHSSGWVTGPGMVELLSEAALLLVKATELKGKLEKELPWVRVSFLEEKRCLLVRPTTSADLRKKKVTWRRGHAFFVASDVLIDAGFPVETGYKKRYEVHLLKKTSKGPTVVIDMREPLATRILPKPKPKGKSNKGA